MPEFQPPKPNWLEEFWKQPMVKKLSHQLGEMFHEAFNSLRQLFSHVSPPGIDHLPDSIRQIFSGFVGFLLVLLGLFALYFFLGWLLRLRERSIEEAPPPARVLDQVVLVNSVHHYRQAQSLADKQDYAEALRHLYMAMLCLLDERKLAPYEATRTNLEYLSLLAQHGSGNQAPEGLPEHFARLARQFEAVRYGMQSLGAGQFDQSCADYKSLQAVIAAGGSHE